MRRKVASGTQAATDNKETPGGNKKAAAVAEEVAVDEDAAHDEVRPPIARHSSVAPLLCFHTCHSPHALPFLLPRVSAGDSISAVASQAQSDKESCIPRK